MLLISSYPKAILHIDGDAFFASCEVAKNPKLKGRPVVTGAERGIVSALTYEAKAMGIKRGMMFKDVKKICPQAVILPSDYETYSLYSIKMYEIVRRFTSQVEEYSIDECFAELTGLRRPMKMSYEKMATKIKQSLDSELGMTFSVGLAPTKVLAKVASKWKKPSGLTFIPGSQAHHFLKNLLLDKIWGIGSQTSAYLNNLGIKTALQLVNKDEEWIKRYLHKPQYEIWQELRGQSIYPIEIGKKNNYKSISKTKTFTPPSSSRDYVFAQLSKNIENACIKLRRHKLATKKISFFLKTQDFKYDGLEFKLSSATDTPTEIITEIKKMFEQVFCSDKLYRATGLVAADLTEIKNRQMDLFGRSRRSFKMTNIFTGVDEIDKKYGKHSVFVGSSWQAINNNRINLREKNKASLGSRFKDETIRKHLNIPYLGIVS